MEAWRALGGSEQGGGTVTAIESDIQQKALRRYRPYPAYKDSGVEWLGEIPEHWEVKPLKAVSALQTGLTLGKEYQESSLVTRPYLRVANVQDGYINLDDVAEVSLPEKDSSRYELRFGDVLMTEGGDYDKLGRGCVWENQVQHCLHQNHIFAVRPRPSHLIPEFLSLTMGSSYGKAYFTATSKQSTNLASTNSTKLRNFPFPLPGESEQNAIAIFLNHETARIDALVAKKRRLIELLQEQRTALITRAVTKGLDPSVPMKDSGVEWLGEIPEHWDIKPFTKYVRERADYRGRTPTKVPSGIFLVTARNIRMGWIDYESSQEFVSEDEYDEIMRRGLPRIDDILFTTEAPLGNVALVDREDIALAQRVIRFRPRANAFESQFTLIAMMSGYFQAQLSTLATGSTAEGIKASKLPMLWLVAPPIPEQQSIAEAMQRENEKIGGIVESISRAITRLDELRTALISAAVTGKIDVREEVV